MIRWSNCTEIRWSDIMDQIDPLKNENNSVERNRDNNSTVGRRREKESDPVRLEQRYKQISYGKATEGYRRYIERVPKTRRRRGDPRTPDRYQVCSKRSWDGQMSKWRRMLHLYDPPHYQEERSDRIIQEMHDAEQRQNNLQMLK